MDRNELIDKAQAYLDKPKETRRMSMDEIMAEMNRIAQDPGNRDQFKALKALAADENGGVILPPPLSDGEMIEMLKRVMRTCGMEASRIAYRRAFRRTDSTIETAPQTIIGDIPDHLKEKIKKIRTMKSFNKMFPELKQGGVPKGYPSRRGPEVKTAFLQKLAARILMDREQRILDAQSGQPDMTNPAIAEIKTWYNTARPESDDSNESEQTSERP